VSAAVGILRDLRFAMQSLRRSPGFTLIAVITLGLGIGANTSAFSILNALLLRPLPYPDGGRVDRIFRATAQNSRGSLSPADYLDLASETNGYGEIAAYGVSDMSLSEPGQPAEMAPGLRVSANLFATLGIEPSIGRSFRPDEALPGNHRVLIISHRCWQNRFGGDAHIVGRSVRVDGEAQEIVGVLPASFNDWRHLGPRKLATGAPPGSDSSDVAPAPSPPRRPNASSPISVAAWPPSTPPSTPEPPGAPARSSTP
jgi:hypothetical protein